MITNRSVPPDDVLPHIMYRDVPAAIAWLTRTFGFTECYRYGEPVSGAQMQIGTAWIMLKRAADGESTPSQLGYGTQSLTIFLNDLEAHFQRAKAAGAKILEDIHETVYGELQYAAEDLDGHHWLFSRHARDVNPEAFGATVARYVSRLHLLPHPSFCYLEIPAADAHHSAAFYEKVFGWNIRHRDTARPSFDDAAGNISGAWVTGRPASRDPGLLPYIWVDDIQATVARLRSHGAEIVDSPHPDSPGSTSTIATFRDPAGNLIGLYQERT
jgi:predicted enzyme related to lactoylglutathione lyase